MSRTTRRISSIAASLIAVAAIGAATVVPATTAAAQPPVVLPANNSVSPSAHSAGSKIVGATTNTWGSFPTNTAITAWTEVRVNGNWSRSQTVRTDSSGGYVIPLTYGANSPGTYTFRVRGQYPDGTIGTSATFDLRRLAQPSAHSAGSRPVGTASSAWGSFDTHQAVNAWTEVRVNGNWSRSQTARTDSSGGYVIPLTYGSDSPGTHTFRVRGQYSDGSIATSREFTLQRTGETKHAWMAAAGIPQSDWTYVDFIVHRESSWNPSARNRSSGACGLAQALPCSKVGPNWNDPVVSLRWQHSYVKDRYGSYEAAYNFWLRNRWY